jgi:hypothetical protein
MLVVLSAVGVLGTALTFVGLWDLSPLIALLCAPVGGSICALVAALVISYRRPAAVPPSAAVRPWRRRRRQRYGAT